MTSCAATTTIRAWEPDQSKHGHYCGIQGPHSLGHGTKGSCTCGRDALVARVASLEQLVEAAHRVIVLEHDPSKSPLENGEVYRRARAFNAALAAVGLGEETAG